MSKLYLTNWIKKNYLRLNSKWDSAPHLLGVNGTFSAEQHQFSQLGESLVMRLQKTMEHPKDVQFAILNTSLPGAWALYGVQCDGVIITTGLVKNIQSVCGQVDRMMQQILTLDGGKENFLRDLWKGIPFQNDDYESFGGLLAHIAFSFIIHHELSHLGLGHEGIRNVGAASEGPTVQGGDDDWFMDELALGASESHSTLQRPSLSSQALEADADLNGLRYTLQFMNYQASRFEKIEVDENDKMGVVWKHFLTSSNNRWFVILAGISIGLYCLISDLDNVTLGVLSKNTHPPIPSRVLAILNVGAALYKEETGEKFTELSNVLLFVACILGMLKNLNGKTTTIDKLLESLKINESVERIDDIGHHFTELADEMSKLNGKRSLYRRFPDFMCWEWYKDSKVIGKA